MKARREERQNKRASGDTGSNGDANRKKSSAPGFSKGRIEKRLEEITAEIEDAESRVTEIDDAFSGKGFFDRTSPAQVKQLKGERSALQEKVEALMAEWEKLEAELEPAR